MHQKDARIEKAFDAYEYFLVAASVLDPVTCARGFAPLKAVRDNCPRTSLTLDEIAVEHEGIRQVNILDDLLQA